MQKVLIAESSEIFRKSLTAALSPYYEVHTCSAGMDAVKRIDQLRPDVLIIDLLLPQIDGISVLQAVSYKPAIILALTTVATESVLEAATGAQADSVILKPCTVRLVMDTLEQLRKKAPALG